MFRWMPIFAVTAWLAAPAEAQFRTPLENLAKMPDFRSHRISSYDRTGGNDDRVRIEPGETKVLAEIEGPGAITHIWNTVMAERYYPRMLILRMYWDGSEIPSAEVPLGDFFGVGHGLDRAYGSAAAAVSSEGRARNCYWYMPFKKSAKVTVTHEGFHAVRFFYYYIDYQTYDLFPADALYFHAQYRQAVPNPAVDSGGVNRDGRANYTVLETEGTGKYVGTVLSAQINEDGWFGEGDDMFFIDGGDAPSIVGTGTEDYFNDAWGFREFDHPYHGVTLWEGSDKGDRVTAYKWHLFDPVAFRESLKMSIEHGHANDREDDWYSVAFWYQTLPGPEPPPMANVFDRLPDEGQLYARRMFVNKEIAVHLENGRADEAIARVDEFAREEPLADEYGYWSLRKSLLLKGAGRLDGAGAAAAEALRKSGRPDGDAKAAERDAPLIHAFAEREVRSYDNRREAALYVVTDWRDSYEVYVDNELAAGGTGGETVRIHGIRVPGGRRIIGVKCRNTGGRGGVALWLSHGRGIESSGPGWKCSTVEYEGWTERRFDDSDWKPAAVAGKLGDGGWAAIREPYQFYTGLIQPDVMWTPEGPAEGQTVWFRKEVNF